MFKGVIIKQQIMQNRHKAYMHDARDTSVPEIKTIEDYHNALKNPRVLIDFFAAWCPPCKKVTPIFDQWSKKYKNYSFFILDIENEDLEDIVVENKVQVLPTFVVYKSGKRVERIKGKKESRIMEYLNGEK